MLWLPSNDFGSIVSSVSSTRPNAALGTTITPGNNTNGSYASVLSTLADDAYGLLINVNSNTTAANARDTLMTIGFDPAGGTSFTDKITDLLVSLACALSLGHGLYYYFPLFIPAGTSIGAKASVNNATVGTLKTFMTAFCRPRRPVKTGKYVVTYGNTAASSSGTAVTSGTTNEGAWTLLGTVGANDRPFFWQLGYGQNQSAMASEIFHCDLGIGDGTNMKTVIQDQIFAASNAEYVVGGVQMGGHGIARPNDGVYGRMQTSGSTTTNLSMAAYAVCE